MFTVMPAIDLRAGRVVRLLQGDYARQTDYAVEPSVLARDYAADGTEWLHVVDLDGARGGTQDNLRVVEALAGAGLKVQAGGGIRSRQDLDCLFDAGVARAVIGSLAVREPQRVCDWLTRYGPERITLALDSRCRNGVWQLASAGWTTREAFGLDDLAPVYVAAGARHVLCTDIDRDGAMSGPNLTLYAHLQATYPALAVQASGGMRDVADVRAVRESGTAGVVLGRALLEGRLALADALQAGRVPAC